MLDFQTWIIILLMIIGVITPVVAYSLKQKSKVEKLETQRESDRKDYDEHIRHSDLEKELLSKISEIVSVQKYMLERIEQDIRELKLKINGGNGYKKSPV